MRYTDITTRTQGPSRCHASVSVVNGKLYVIGGMSHRFKYVNVFDIEKLTWKTAETKGSVPSQLWGHSTAVVEDRYIYVWGGRTPARRTQLVLILDTEKMEWTGIRRFIGQAPKACTEHSCTTWTDDRLVIFGGFTGETTLSQTFFYHIRKAKWEEIKQAEGALWPGTRCGHSAILSSDGGKLLIFGGYRSDPWYLNDTWMLDLTARQWRPVSTTPDATPHPRTGSVSGLLGQYGVVMLGHMHTTFLSDVWYFDFDAELWETEPPCKMLSDAGMGWIGASTGDALYVVPAYQHTVQHILKLDWEPNVSS